MLIIIDWVKVRALRLCFSNQIFVFHWLIYQCKQRHLIQLTSPLSYCFHCVRAILVSAIEPLRYCVIVFSYNRTFFQLGSINQYLLSRSITPCTALLVSCLQIFSDLHRLIHEDHSWRLSPEPFLGRFFRSHQVEQETMSWFVYCLHCHRLFSQLEVSQFYRWTQPQVRSRLWRRMKFEQVYSLADPCWG